MATPRKSNQIEDVTARTSAIELSDKQPHAVTTDKAHDGFVGGAEYKDLKAPPPAYEVDVDEGILEDVHHNRLSEVPETAGDLTTQIISVDDDPSLNPWTFRTLLVGVGLSLFGSTLSSIYYFKPQTVLVSNIFLAVISYILGEFLAKIIPRRGFLRYLNPHPFNHKEHAAIIVMASSAANTAQGTEVLAVQRLYYNTSPNAGLCILLLISSQLLGYGIAGLLRSVLVYPTKMLYPSNLANVSLLETLHRDKSETGKRLKVFYIGFATLFVWTLFPEWIFPWLNGISVFCLANQRSSLFTNLFGGAAGNEGLGFLSISLDWNYISNGYSPLWYPLQTLANNVVGWVLCITVFLGVYYNNTWNAKNFPFLSQLLWDQKSTPEQMVMYNQTLILTPNNEIDPAALAKQGLPYFASTYVAYIISTNIAITATISHLLLWNWNDLKGAWDWLRPSKLRTMFKWSAWTDDRKYTEEEVKTLDPHYRLMLAYKEVPAWWYMLVLILSMVLGIAIIYAVKSTLPWYGFIVANALGAVCILFFSAQYAITGFQFIIQPIVQMMGGFLHPGKPLANMYFTLFGFNSVKQAGLLLADLKFAQYVKLAPRATFTAQFLGTLVGACLNYIMMMTITKNQREILLSSEGTNIWSGQNVQQYNSQALSWAIAKQMFSVGGRYQWVTLGFLIGFAIPVPFWFIHKKFPKLRLDYWNTAIICYYVGFLCVGINSSLTSFFIVGFFSQFYLRKYRTKWFVKYNYILSAALDGGTQVMVFLMTFAVQGGSGKRVAFPTWWGNPDMNKVNPDYCKMINLNIE